MDKLSYLGGFVDGEGSIAIGINNGNNNRKRYYLRLSVHQLDKRPLVMLQEEFGGSIRLHSNKGANQRPIYEWVLVSKNARDAISVLRPYLIVKAEQADVGLEFQAIMDSRNLPKRTSLSIEEVSIRHSYYEKISKMKWSATQ